MAWPMGTLLRVRRTMHHLDVRASPGQRPAAGPARRIHPRSPADSRRLHLHPGQQLLQAVGVVGMIVGHRHRPTGGGCPCSPAGPPHRAPASDIAVAGSAVHQHRLLPGIQQATLSPWPTSTAIADSVPVLAAVRCSGPPPVPASPPPAPPATAYFRRRSRVSRHPPNMAYTYTSQYFRKPLEKYTACPGAEASTPAPPTAHTAPGRSMTQPSTRAAGSHTKPASTVTKPAMKFHPAAGTDQQVARWRR